MRAGRKFGMLLVTGIIALGICGCSAANATDTIVMADSGMEQTPIVDYTVPQQQPNILVDRQGYQIGSEKEAVVKGKALPEHFHIIDQRTQELVYSGTLEQITYLEEGACYIGYADFTGFDRVGDYYLQCDTVGESYSFRIDDANYEQLFYEQLAEMEAACDSGNISLDGINQLLIAYEWYPQLFEDADADEIPDTLEHITAWIDNNAQNMTAEGDYLVAVLAKFSYLYQGYNRKYATQCLQMASNLHSQITNHKNADSFYALAELYRASGLREYELKIEEQAGFFEAGGSYLEQMGYLYGTMTYLVTRQDIDIDLCSTLMSNMMARAEEIADVHDDILHPLFPRNNGHQDLTKKAFELACANYVMNNYQYNHVQEEFFHYMMGRNKDSRSLYLELETREGYLVLLAQLTNIYF